MDGKGDACDTDDDNDDIIDERVRLWLGHVTWSKKMEFEHLKCM